LPSAVSQGCLQNGGQKQPPWLRDATISSAEEGKTDFHKYQNPEDIIHASSTASRTLTVLLNSREIASVFRRADRGRNRIMNVMLVSVTERTAGKSGPCRPSSWVGGATGRSDSSADFWGIPSCLKLVAGGRLGCSSELSVYQWTNVEVADGKCSLDRFWWAGAVFEIAVGGCSFG